MIGLVRRASSVRSMAPAGMSAVDGEATARGVGDDGGEWRDSGLSSAVFAARRPLMSSAPRPHADARVDGDDAS